MSQDPKKNGNSSDPMIGRNTPDQELPIFFDRQAPREIAGKKSIEEVQLPFTRLGHYDVIRRIGQGDIGDILLGHDAELDRPVALKVLPQEMSGQKDFVNRFRQQAAAVARLSHPNIIQIFYAGEDRGYLFFAMQYVSGNTLTQLLSAQSPLKLDYACAIFEQLLSGLVHAHEQGIIHQNIKPDNILIDDRLQRAMLTDFGFGKSLQALGDMTPSGIFLGTTEYLSPEQRSGQPVDHRADLYSLGVVLFQMLTGRLPLHGADSTSLVFQHVNEHLPQIKLLNNTIPMPLIAIVNRLLKKNPADRYLSAAESLAALQAFRNSSEAHQGSNLVDSPKTAVIQAPAFAEPPSLPETPSPIVVETWLSRMQDWIGQRLNESAPQLYEKLQDTQQQLDGAVKEYERRSEVIAKRLQDAREVRKQLEYQRDEWVHAQNEIHPHHDRIAAEAHQENCRLQIEQLGKELERQDTELDEMQLQVTKINTSLERLGSERQVLKARLATAMARAHVHGAMPKKRFRFAMFATVTFALFTVLFLAWVMLPPSVSSVDYQSLSMARVEQAEPSAVPENLKEAVPQSPPPKLDQPNVRDYEQYSTFFREYELQEAPTVIQTMGYPSETIHFVSGTYAGGANMTTINPDDDKITVREHPRHEAPVSAVTITPDWRFFASADIRGIIHVSNQGGRLVKTLDAQLSRDGSSGRIHFLQLTADGSKLLSTGDNAIVLWDVLRERKITEYQVGPKNLCWMPGRNKLLKGPGACNADTLALNDKGGLIRLRIVGNELTTEPIDVSDPSDNSPELNRADTLGMYEPLNPKSFIAFGSGVVHTAFAREKRYFVTSLMDQSLVVWDVRNQTVRQRFADKSKAENKSLAIRNDSGFYTVAITQDARFVLTTTGSDKKLQIWKTNPPKDQIKQFQLDGKLNSLAISADGKTMAIGRVKGLNYFELESPQTDRKFHYENITKTATAVTFMRDGERIAYGTGDPGTPNNFIGFKRMISDKKPPQENDPWEARKLLGHTEAITSLKLWKKDSEMISASRDGSIRFWSTESGDELSKIDIGVPINALAISPKEDVLLVATEEDTIRVLDLSERKELTRIVGHKYLVNDVRWSRDGRQIITAGADLTVRIWDGVSYQQKAVLSGHSSRVNSAALFAEGRYALTGSDDATVRLWDVEQAKEVKKFAEHFGAVLAVDVNIDAEPSIAKGISVGADGIVRIWDLGLNSTSNIQ